MFYFQIELLLKIKNASSYTQSNELHKSLRGRKMSHSGKVYFFYFLFNR